MRARRSFAHIQRPVVDIGGLGDIKFRSKAEARYAAYLQWLVNHGQLAAWDYECRTFWFTPDLFPGRGVRRGVTSYKPDFAVYPPSPTGAIKCEWHEVKGYMDARSKTALARMERYYPDEKVVVIDSKHMAALKRQVGAIVPGWIA